MSEGRLGGPATADEHVRPTAHPSRFFQIGGITVRVRADVPLAEASFHPKFRHFAVDGPGADTVTLHHHFGLPALGDLDLAEEVYRRPPWAVYRGRDSWTYLGISPDAADPEFHVIAVFGRDYGEGHIYHPEEAAEDFAAGRLHSLTHFATDQVYIAQLLARRQGCYLHSSAVILDGKGLVFVGHSGAGKSTTLGLLEGHAEVLCDDRNIVRRHPDGWRLYGTWSHGDIPIVSGRSAPLEAVLFLVQAPDNRLVPLPDRGAVFARLFGCVVKPLGTQEWWGTTLGVLEGLAAEVPCSELHLDRSGRVLDVLREL